MSVGQQSRAGFKAFSGDIQSYILNYPNRRSVWLYVPRPGCFFTSLQSSRIPVALDRSSRTSVIDIDIFNLQVQDMALDRQLANRLVIIEGTIIEMVRAGIGLLRRAGPIL